MNQWISAVNSYYYPYMIYHVSHERRMFPELGIASDEKVVALALPKIEVGLQVIERELGHGRQTHVSEISGVLSLAGADGGVADRATLPCCVAAARSYRACARMGGFASTEILTVRPACC
jgi:hypothetical protein